MSSVDLKNKFKGWEYSLNIINNLKINIDVIIVGKNGSNYKNIIDTRHNVIAINQTFDSKLLASYYRRADLLLHTSIADNCPLTILESLASGVPVITFNTGGIPELICHNMNGWISNQGDTEDSIKIIEYLNEHRETLDAWREKSISMATEKFSNEIFLEKHISIYREITNAKKAQ